MKKKNIYIVILILGIFITISSFFISSYGYKDGLFLSYFKEPLVILFNLVPIYLVLIILAYLFKSLKLSFIITSIAVNIGAYVNYIKIIYREEPFYWSDLNLFGEAFTMAKKYDLNFKSLNFIVLVITIIITFQIAKRLKDININKNKRYLRMIVSLIILISFSIGILFNYNIYHSLGKKTDLNIWVEPDSYQSKGFIYPFIYSIYSTKPYKYSDYNKKEAEALYNSFIYKNIPEDKKVNVMGIMLESFKDFSMYQNEKFVFQRDPYEYFHKLQKESIHGNLYVNTFGGGTFITESNFLTGYKNNPKYNKPVESYVRYFDEQGYDTAAFHPNTGSFYRRKYIYPEMGFENFYEYDNTFKNISENLLMDRPFFEFILNKFYEKPKDKDIFYFGVTYENHGPYSKEPVAPENEFIKWNDSYSREWYNYFNRYLTGINDTSNSMQYLVDSLRKSKEPVILIMFGDHSPSMGDNKILFDMFNIYADPEKTEGIKNIYMTPYIVWANDAAKKVIGKDFVGTGRDLEPAFLMSDIFKYMGWEANQYNQFLQEYTKEVTVLKNSWFCIDGEYVHKLNKENKRKIHNYKNMEYYTSHLLDKEQ